MIQLSRRKDIQSLNLRIILLRFFDPHQTKLIIIISDCRRPEKEDATFTSSYVISVPRPLISRFFFLPKTSSTEWADISSA